MFQYIQSMKVQHYQLTLQKKKTANPKLQKQGEGKGNTRRDTYCRFVRSLNGNS